MCDPVSMLTAAAVGVGAVGQVYSANATASAANANAIIQERNAARSEEQAKDAIRRGQIEEERKRREGAQIIGATKAKFGASNLDLGYGSPLDTIIAAATGVELDALTIRENTMREADDYDMQAFNQRAGATISRAEGKNARTAGFLGAAGSVLSGGSNVYKYRAEVG